jgi:hypothetical protein
LNHKSNKKQAEHNLHDQTTKEFSDKKTGIGASSPYLQRSKLFRGHFLEGECAHDIQRIIKGASVA